VLTQEVGSVTWQYKSYLCMLQGHTDDTSD